MSAEPLFNNSVRDPLKSLFSGTESAYLPTASNNDSSSWKTFDSKVSFAKPPEGMIRELKEKPMDALGEVQTPQVQASQKTQPDLQTVQAVKPLKDEDPVLQKPAVAPLKSPTQSQTVKPVKPVEPQPSKPSADKETTEPEGSEEQQAVQAEAKEISDDAGEGIKIDHFITSPDGKDELKNANLSRSDLVTILETFVNVLMDNKRPSEPETVHENLPSPLNFEPPKEGLVPQEVLAEKNTEIDELKTLLVEAQTTIIKLLTDRVEDKAKIATLEGQVRYLPDHQRHHESDKQAPVAQLQSSDSAEMREDLSKVKAELQTIQQNLKKVSYKNGFEKEQSGWSLKTWFSKLVRND